MKTLILYDNKGTIFYKAQGDLSEPIGIPFLWVEVPQNKRLLSINTSTEEHTPVYEDIPKSEVSILQEQVTALNIALAEIMGV